MLLPVRFSRIAPLTLSLLAFGCADEPSNLFDEDGVWSLTAFDLTGTAPLDQIDERREDGFLLKFDSGRGLVAAANCLDPRRDPNAPPDSNPGSVFCSNGDDRDDPANWACNCFAYRFEGERMQWLPYDAGSAAPTIVADPALGSYFPCAGAEPPADPATMGNPLLASDVEDVELTQVLQSLPINTWASDGTCSRYQIQQKAARLFDVSTCEAQCFGG